MTATTFKEAYDVLQRHAHALRDEEEPNIDNLLDIVNESVAAYKVCRQRIDAVEKALEEALVTAGLDGAARPSKSTRSGEADRRPEGGAARPEADGNEGSDDDIPF